MSYMNKLKVKMKHNSLKLVYFYVLHLIWVFQFHYRDFAESTIGFGISPPGNPLVRLCLRAEFSFVKCHYANYLPIEIIRRVIIMYIKAQGPSICAKRCMLYNCACVIRGVFQNRG